MSVIDKYLTAAMGECQFRVGGDGFSHICSDCGLDVLSHFNYSFSTWQGFGLLWEWAQEQEWWSDELFFRHTGEGHITDSGCCVMAIARIPYIVEPGRFANAVYEFLKGRES